MAEFDRKEVILIFTFWIFCPTLDMVTDMNMAYRLFRGPSPDLWVSGGMSDKVNEIKHCNAFASCSDQLPRNLILASTARKLNFILMTDRQTHRYISCS